MLFQEVDIQMSISLGVAVSDWCTQLRLRVKVVFEGSLVGTEVCRQCRPAVYTRRLVGRGGWNILCGIHREAQFPMMKSFG